MSKLINLNGKSHKIITRVLNHELGLFSKEFYSNFFEGFFIVDIKKFHFLPVGAIFFFQERLK